METPNKIADAIIERLVKICKEVSFFGVEWREEMSDTQVYQDVIEPLLKELNYPLPYKMQDLKEAAEKEKKRLENDDFSDIDSDESSD